MPVLDGLEALRRLRQLAPVAGVPVISISASVGDDGERRALAAGANAFLTKPFRAEELLSLMAGQLRIRLRMR